jgi:hypothetical protein
MEEVEQCREQLPRVTQGAVAEAKLSLLLLHLTYNAGAVEDQKSAQAVVKHLLLTLFRPSMTVAFYRGEAQRQ